MSQYISFLFKVIAMYGQRLSRLLVFHDKLDVMSLLGIGSIPKKRKDVIKMSFKQFSPFEEEKCSKARSESDVRISRQRDRLPKETLGIVTGGALAWLKFNDDSATRRHWSSNHWKGIEVEKQLGRSHYLSLVSKMEGI